MNSKHTCVVGLDFVDTDGVRHTNFSLCRFEDGLSTATIDFLGDEVSRIAAVAQLSPRISAIIRLASIYRKRSTPRVFGKRPVSA